MKTKDEVPKHFSTRSDIPLKETYWPDDSLETGSTEKARKSLGEPGEVPFGRGVQKTMYRGRLWTMRQYAGFATAKESNERYRYLLSQGTMGLSVAFDLPTQLGFDPDHPRSKGEVGKVGVSIATLDEMRTLFDQIDLSKISTSMTINASASILLAFYVALAKEKGCKVSELRGTVQNDILKEYIARGNYIYPPKGALRITTDMFDWCTREVPKWNPISISGYHIREAGSNASQELAFTFANGIAYVEAALARGLKIDDFAEQLSFFFNVHSDFFEEIAKSRAARIIWARIVKDRFKAQNPRSMALRFHSQTAGSTLTAQQPENNVVRVTLQALASVLGGTQSLHTNALDEALALPTEETALLALRTQQVIGYESNVTQVVDPLGGSWFIESLTTELVDRCFKLLDTIEKKGGTVQCIENGFIQGEILNSAYQDQRRIDEGKIKVVGVNCFQESAKSNSKSSRKTLKVSPENEKDAVQRIQAYRKNRSQPKTDAALSALKSGAQGDVNLQELVLNAVESQATLGEISDTLRTVFGEYTDSASI